MRELCINDGAVVFHQRMNKGRSKIVWQLGLYQNCVSGAFAADVNAMKQTSNYDIGSLHSTVTFQRFMMISLIVGRSCRSGEDECQREDKKRKGL